MKRCPRCGRELPATLEFFTRNRARSDGLEHYCRPCTQLRKREYMRRYTPKHRDEKSAYDRQYRERNAELLRARKRAYYEANREQIIGKYHDPRFRQRIIANQHRRRARSYAGGSHSAADVRAQYERQKGRCYWCKAKVGETYHVDHVTPLSKGGTNGPENIVIACPSCNLHKQAQHPMDFAGRLC